jgi:hypothetical protein
MWTGTIGQPLRVASQAAPPLWDWPQPSGLRPPSGKINRFQPSAISDPAYLYAFERYCVEREGKISSLHTSVEEIIGSSQRHDLVPPWLRQDRKQEGGIEVAGMVGREYDRPHHRFKAVQPFDRRLCNSVHERAGQQVCPCGPCKADWVAPGPLGVVVDAKGGALRWQRDRCRPGGCAQREREVTQGRRPAEFPEPAYHSEPLTDLANGHWQA